MVNVAKLLTRLSIPKVQEQVEDSSNNLPAYEGRGAPNPILVRVECLLTLDALEG